MGSSARKGRSVWISGPPRSTLASQGLRAMRRVPSARPRKPIAARRRSPRGATRGVPAGVGQGPTARDRRGNQPKPRSSEIIQSRLKRNSLSGLVHHTRRQRQRQSMATITATMVKDLREKTGAGMMDCKAALNEAQGDMEAAVDWLRTKGLAKAAKKAGRVAAEGLIGLAADVKQAALVEVNSETDFVARNQKFQDMVSAIAAAALKTKGDVDKLAAAKYGSGKATVAETIKEMIGSIGENMNLRRAAHLSAAKGVVASYMHNTIAPGLGKIGVIVALESSGNPEALKSFGRQIAMHIAAANPQAVDVDSLDKAVIERERAVLTEQAKESGKPAQVIEKMVEGRLRKFYEEVVLLAQAFVHDPETTVAKAVANAEKAAGRPIKITGFYRYALGEGIDRPDSDFAAEVAAAASHS